MTDRLDSEPPMTTAEARGFIAAVPWRWVRQIPVGEGLTEAEAIEKWGEYRHVKPDPHQYVIAEWREVDTAALDRFVKLIKTEGCRATYRAPYRPDYEMRNRYLELDGWCYWWIRPNMLNRELAEHRKHVPIPE
jgi:hypothetical protein